MLVWKICFMALLTSYQYFCRTWQSQNTWKWCAIWHPQFLQQQLFPWEKCALYWGVIKKRVTLFQQNSFNVWDFVLLHWDVHMHSHSSSVIVIPASFSHLSIIYFVEWLLRLVILLYSFAIIPLVGCDLYALVKRSTNELWWGTFCLISWL